MVLKKNMKLGNKSFYLFIVFFYTSTLFLLAENSIISSPLINIEKIKPSFEEVVEKMIINLIIKILKKEKKI